MLMSKPCIYMALSDGLDKILNVWGDLRRDAVDTGRVLFGPWVTVIWVRQKCLVGETFKKAISVK
jgi:hypothetical protein